LSSTFRMRISARYLVFASPDGRSNNKNVVFSGTSLWIGLVSLSII
ncbi:hypothetical protein BAE44_0014772, partial [Dichanthelium oligosanthes]